MGTGLGRKRPLIIDLLVTYYLFQLAWLTLLPVVMIVFVPPGSLPGTVVSTCFPLMYPAVWIAVGITILTIEGMFRMRLWGLRLARLQSIGVILGCVYAVFAVVMIPGTGIWTLLELYPVGIIGLVSFVAASVAFMQLGRAELQELFEPENARAWVPVARSVVFTLALALIICPALNINRPEGMRPAPYVMRAASLQIPASPSPKGQWADWHMANAAKKEPAPKRPVKAAKNPSPVELWENETIETTIVISSRAPDPMPVELWANR